MNSPLVNSNNINNTNQLINTRNTFEELYDCDSEVGKGRYATVKKCFCKRTRKCFAAKIIKNYRTKNNFNLNIINNEIIALTMARSHPSIVTLYEIFQQKSETILILEYATEKDLHVFLDSEGVFEEEKACEIVYQILKALSFLHSKNILHLDIKPENVLLMNSLGSRNNSFSINDDCEHQNTNDILISDQLVKVKLCDFSFSQIMTPGKEILGMMGTVAYSAPEVLQYEALTKATDMWSLGVLTHVLLTAYTPFGNGTEKNLETHTNILSVRDQEFKCTDEYFSDVSKEAQDFIESLIKYKPKQRLSVEEALNHKWFKKLNTDTISEDIENLNLNRKSVELEIRDRVVYSNSFSNKNVCSSKTLSSITNTIIEIKDDKNNNNLASLNSPNNIKSMSGSSLSSDENCEIKSEQYTYEVSKSEVKKSDYCMLNSLISSTTSSFIMPAGILSNESTDNHANNFSSSVFCQTSKISNQY